MIPRRKIGRTGVEVSALGFGCMRLPVIDNDTTRIDEEQATAMLRLAIDDGVNYVDTAFPYHGSNFEKGGESEPFVGRALRDGYREKVNLATKLPSWLMKTRDEMDRTLDMQLERLGTDHIDFYLIHTLCTSLWPVMKRLDYGAFLDSAIRDGRIRYAGFSFHDHLALFKEIVDDYPWSFCQIQYNYLDETYQAGTEGLKYAAEKGLGVVIMEPLRGGHLATRLPDDAVEAFRATVPDRSPVDWALRWVWNHPEVSVVLSGMSTLDQVRDNLKIARNARANALSETELATIDAARKIIRDRTAVACTACNYCQPCEQGVAIPKIFALMNDYHLFDTEEARRVAKLMYGFHLSEEERANHCIQCGECESHCPQGLPIIEKLEEAHALLS